MVSIPPTARPCTIGSPAPVIVVDPLIHADRVATPQHRGARRAIAQAANGRGVAGRIGGSLREFCSVVTQPAPMGMPSMRPTPRCPWSVATEAGSGLPDVRPPSTTSAITAPEE
ncbi:MAG TPA: hypothetical protein VGF59_15045, partial [Bryobacteraceae bacterium]